MTRARHNVGHSRGAGGRLVDVGQGGGPRPKRPPKNVDGAGLPGRPALGVVAPLPKRPFKGTPRRRMTACVLAREMGKSNGN